MTDNLGTVRDLVDTQGNVDEHRVYDAYGNITDETGAVDHLFAFTARLFDEQTGLQWNLHRWYDASVGRWLSEDPARFAAEDPNLYRYVRNEPPALIDPWGLQGVKGGINRETNLHFDLMWPFAGTKRAAKTPRKVVDGTLMVKPQDLQNPKTANLSIRIGLERLHRTEEDLDFWNHIRGYEGVFGMDEKGRRWLWPNLVWLLNGPGLPRLSYGLGEDRADTLDDFAAVVIRHYKSPGVEYGTTAKEPLVSFRWHEWKTNFIKPGKKDETVFDTSEKYEHTVIHSAKSDEFTVHIGPPCAEGVIGVWFLYADVWRGDRPHRPKEGPVGAGATFSYFEIKYLYRSNNVAYVVKERSNQPPPTGLSPEYWGPYVGWPRYETFPYKPRRTSTRPP